MNYQQPLQQSYGTPVNNKHMGMSVGAWVFIGIVISTIILYLIIYLLLPIWDCGGLTYTIQEAQYNALPEKIKSKYKPSGKDMMTGIQMYNLVNKGDTNMGCKTTKSWITSILWFGALIGSLITLIGIVIFIKQKINKKIE